MDFLRLLEGLRTPFLDQFFQFITYFGQEVILIAVICTLYWCVNKRFAYQLGFTYFIAGLFVQTLKIACRIPRPWVLDPDFTPVKSAVPAATGYSFPSGHSQGGTCLFAPMMLNTKKIYIKFICAFAFLAIGFSRMYLGVHTPKDVVVSIGISLLTAIFIWKFQEPLFDNPLHKKKIMLLLSLISIFVSIYALVLLSKGSIDTTYAADCCKASGAGFGFAIGWYIETTYIQFSPKSHATSVQFLKVIIGISIAVLLKEGIKALFGSSILIHMIRYFIVVLWILAIYPFIFQKATQKCK